MKAAGLMAVISLVAAPAFAQSGRGYVQGLGGVDSSSVAPAASSLFSGTGAAQAGVRVARHVFLFGEFGRYADLEPANIQASADATAANLSNNLGLDLNDSSRMPATYGLGGVRFEGRAHNRVTPYALAGFGVAHLTPSARFDYSAGVLPGADPSAPAPAIGADVTSQLISAGSFTQPLASSAFMFAIGGGAEVRLARRWVADVGYRYARISAATPLNANGATFGVGVRF